MITISVELSTSPIEPQWGKNALLSQYNEKNQIVIHHKSDHRLETIQRAARRIATQGIKQVTLQGEGWDLDACWSFWLGFKNAKGEQLIDFPQLSQLELVELQHRIKIIGWVRNMINLPAEELSPVQLAEFSIDLIEEFTPNFEYKLIKGEALREQNIMGIYTVGRGSKRSPVLFCLDYNPTGDKTAPVLACLVGKGVTFDSGGYSIKQSSFMDSMKSDMGGAALVMGALVLAIAQGLTKRVKLYLCCADNLVGGNAFKLGDVITYRNGKRVEVMNTDAEGRLVLADGLIEAELQHPEFIIDCATLTGAAKMAVGNDYHTVLTFDDQLSAAFFASAAKENEPFWRLPLAPFHRQQLPSAFADISNVASGAGTAGASTAAAFLSYFLKKYQKNWLHIDCSATYRKFPSDLWAVGATGLGVRTLANLLLSKAKFE